jgi:hypothetical protein
MTMESSDTLGEIVHRVRKGLAIAAVLPLFTLVQAGDAAAAPTCTMSSHCYGIANLPLRINGATTNLKVTCMSVTNWRNELVTEEMWVSTNGSWNYWVELGMTVGTPVSTRKMFWADNRPNGGGYHEHYPSTAATLNHTYINTISYAGGNAWNVYIQGGSPIGTSGANPGPSVGAQVGEEITTNSAKGAATHTSLWYKDTGNTFHAGWPNSTISQDVPPRAAWISTHNSMRAYSNCTAPSVAEKQGVAAVSSPATVDSVLDVARLLAEQNGDANPTGISYVKTTRQQATSLVGTDQVDTDQDAYLVQLHGNFVGHAAKTPPGGAKPTGTVLTASVDAATGELLDWSLTDSAAELNKLGPATTVQ